MENKKPWWKSKTILTIGMTALGTIAANPPQNKQQWAQTAILIGGSVLAGAFRATATTQVK